MIQRGLGGSLQLNFEEEVFQRRHFIKDDREIRSGQGGKDLPETDNTSRSCRKNSGRSRGKFPGGRGMFGVSVLVASRTATGVQKATESGNGGIMEFRIFPDL